MAIVSILVDGGFYQKRAQYLWGKATSEERADELMAYCRRHIGRHDHLYRIFYYDCAPSSKKVYHPLKKVQIDLSKTELYTWMMEFQEHMRNKRKVALRLGQLLESNLQYVIKPELTKKICNGTLLLSDLDEQSLVLNIMQKGVDMRVGLDIASMAYKKQVNKMILISGDSDFVPAAKLARREEIDFVLDPMGAAIRPDLNEHIDGLVSPHFVPKKDAIVADVAKNKESEEEANMA